MKATEELKFLADLANKAQQADMNEVLRDIGEGSIKYNSLTAH
jgi:hypothetical protein